MAVSGSPNDRGVYAKILGGGRGEAGNMGGKCEFAGSQRGLSDTSDADLRRARAISVSTWPEQTLSRTVQLAST